MPRNYEATLIFNSQVPEEGVEEAVRRYQDFLSGQNAVVVDVIRWGVRKLAYEIARHQQGVYVFIQFQAEPGVPAELDRLCRIDESVLRHMIVVSGEGPEAAQDQDEAVENDAELEVEDEDAEEDEDGNEDVEETDGEEEAGE